MGEYAVLDGAPAVVTAVDRGVACEVTDADALAIDAPGDDRFVRAALAGAPPGRYAFADWNPARLRSGGKAGLGGSAAAVVAALVAARDRAGLPPDPAAVHRRGHAVHAAVQGGGSGVDVAASALGGTLRFEAGAATALAPVRPRVVYSGSSAATGPRVARYLACPDRASFVADSRALVDAFPADPLRALAAAGARLRAMAEAAGLAYWTPGIGALVALARDHGGAAKPSGAGGGDVVVALFPDDGAGDAFEAAAADAGFEPIEVAVAPAARAYSV